jgi:hypothetical protein
MKSAPRTHKDKNMVSDTFDLVGKADLPLQQTGYERRGKKVLRDS